MSRDAELQTIIRNYAAGTSTHDEFTQSLGRLFPLAEKAIPKTASGVKELADVTVALIKAAVEKYQAKVKLLEDRLLSVETELTAIRNKSMTFRGAFADGDLYRPGETVRHAGCLYVAKSATMRTPGTDASWVLMAGRNGA
jgi:hypothetical protein